MHYVSALPPGADGPKNTGAFPKSSDYDFTGLDDGPAVGLRIEQGEKEPMETEAGKMLESQAVMSLMMLGIGRSVARTFIQNNVIPARPVSPMVLESVRQVLQDPTTAKPAGADMAIETSAFVRHMQGAMNFYINGPADAATAAGGALVGAAVGTAVLGPGLGTAVGGLIGGLIGGSADNAFDLMISAAIDAGSNHEKLGIMNLTIFNAMINAQGASLTVSAAATKSASDQKAKESKIQAAQKAMMKTDTASKTYTATKKG